MQKIFVNKEGFLKSSDHWDATIEIEITDEIYKQIFSYLYIPKYSNLRFTGSSIELVDESLTNLNILRQRRQEECFDIVDNRSKLWYDNLTEEQYKELQEWYQAWLDATETKVTPEKPEWL